MNRNLLTIVGCSTSLAVLLATSHAAQANTTTFRGSAGSAVQTIPGSSDLESPSAMIDPNSDTVGDLAIAKFHCDCPSCRVAIVQILQTGQSL